jgi:hypothetical protein
VDVTRLVGRPVPSLDARGLLLLTTSSSPLLPPRSSATVASMRPSPRHRSPAGIEGAAVVGCFLVLGPALGLWRRASV